MIGQSLRACTLALVTALAFAAPLAANAHDPGRYYEARWELFPVRSPGDPPTVAWVRAPSTEPGAAELLPVAAGPWNDAGATFSFADRGSDTREPGDDTCDPTAPAPIGRGPIDDTEGILAVTIVCAVAGQAVYFEMVYDEAEPWWFGPADAVPSGRFDFASVITHEFGHATGFARHFLPGVDPECEPVRDHHTMCAAIGPGNPLPRTPEVHDVHTFVDAYR